MKINNHGKMDKKVYYYDAILLAILGGIIGLQEFYLKRYVLGCLAVLFCWTGIPALVALIEVFVWLFNGDKDFDKKHNNATENIFE